MANRSRNRRPAASAGGPSVLEKLTPRHSRGARPARLWAAGRGHRHRLELGAPRRLRGPHPQPDADLQRKGARRPRPRGADQACCRRRGREGARRAAALPRAVRHHAGRSGCGCSRPRPAATRSNGQDFIAAAERICRTKIDVISGKREAELTALGVVSGFHRPDGIVGDLGGGSLELVDVHGAPHQARHHAAARRPGAAGPLRPLDQEGREDRRGCARRRQAAARAARAARSTPSAAPGARWRGCTWRRWAIRCTSCTATSSAPRRRSSSRGWCAGSIRRRCRRSRWCAARRPLLPYAALVLEHIVREAEPRDVVISALGVREGLLYSLLDAEERKQGSAARRRAANSTCCARARRSTARS